LPIAFNQTPEVLKPPGSHPPPDDSHWHGFSFHEKKLFMVVPFIALIIVIIAVVWFFAGAAKRKNKGKDLGDPAARS
jgi:hypothetical protein